MSIGYKRPPSRRDALALLGGTGTLSLVGGVRARDAPAERREKRSALKTIGVLGGMGPQATMDFEARVHRAAQRLIPPRQNSGYPPMVVYYHRHPPFLVNEDASPHFPIQADPRLLDAARRLGTWADFLVITSNGPHLIQDEIEQAAGRKVLSMIEITLEEVQQRGWRNVGVLGFGDPTIYTSRLRSMGIRHETVDPDLRARLDTEIMKVMEGRDGPASSATAREAVDALRLKKVDGIVLGCTEIPLLVSEQVTGPDLIDPAELLAEAAVKRALARALTG